MTRPTVLKPAAYLDVESFYENIYQFVVTEHLVASELMLSQLVCMLLDCEAMLADVSHSVLNLADNVHFSVRIQQKVLGLRLLRANV